MKSLIQKHKSSYSKIIVGALLVKISYHLFALLLVYFSVIPADTDCGFALFARNDSEWYKKIVEVGYEKASSETWQQVLIEHKQVSWAFFPLYPYSVKAISVLFHLSFYTAAYIHACIFSLLCFLLFYHIAYIQTSQIHTALYITFVFIVFPFHYYFSMAYSEALYTSLLLASFLSVYYKKYSITILASTLLVLCRVNGLVAILPLCIAVFESNKMLHVKDILSFYKHKKLFLQLLCFIGMPIVFTMYLYYQYTMTGTLFAFSKAQIGWYRNLSWPYISFFSSSEFQIQFNSIYTIAFMLVAIAAYNKMPKHFSVLIWINILLATISGSLRSMQRFLIVLFPFAIIIGNIILQKGYKLRIPILILLFLVQLWSFYYWIISDPFSY